MRALKIPIRQALHQLVLFEPRQTIENTQSLRAPNVVGTRLPLNGMALLRQTRRRPG
jgi:hypothetical protein